MDDKTGFHGVELPHVQHFTTFWGVEPVQHRHFCDIGGSGLPPVFQQWEIFFPIWNQTTM